jgi:DNA-binding NarL/FixJ family response regulator
MKTLWILEDHTAFRRSLEWVFEEDPEVRCGASFGNAEAMLKALREANPPPDALLMDLGLPGRSGLEAIGEVRRISPGTMVVVLTVFEDDEKVFKAVCEGASGYLLKTSRSEEWIRAVKEALSGGALMSPKIARRVLEMFSSFAPKQPETELTEREREVLRMLVAGLTNKELAAKLEMSVHTVDFHLRHIYGKLQVRNRSGAVARALKEKLT